jgi:autotransporter-associated beta strand protein
MTFSGSNNYSGNTTISSGTLLLAETGHLKFIIGANGVNNTVAGAGTATLNGVFDLDLTGANLTPGNSWTLVNRATLNGATSFGANFTVTGFTKSGNVHTQTVGSNILTFRESTGVLTVSLPSGYSSWATTNAGGQAANLDFDNDGVSNGVEYFLNAPAGFTANPAVVGGSVTWTNGGNIPSAAYGTQFVVQTSPDLTSWTNVPSGDANLVNTAGSVQYILPTGQTKRFVRLVVTPD